MGSAGLESDCVAGSGEVDSEADGVCSELVGVVSELTDVGWSCDDVDSGLAVLVLFGVAWEAETRV